MIGFKQSMKVFSAKFSLPMDPRKFSPSNVYRYTVQMADCGCAFYASVPEQELGQLISPQLYLGGLQLIIYNFHQGICVYNHTCMFSGIWTSSHCPLGHNCFLKRVRHISTTLWLLQGMTQLLYKQAHKNTLAHTHYSVMYIYILVNNASWSMQRLTSELY